MKKRNQIAGIIVINLAFAIALKVIYFLWEISGYSPARLKDIYPRFYEFVFVSAQHTKDLFIFWFILFLSVNGFIIYLLGKQYNKSREFLLSAVVLILAFAAGEFILRKLHYIPGIHTHLEHFRPVDSLFFMDGFTADSLGIMKIDLKARRIICDKINTENKSYAEKQIPEIFILASESIELINGKIDNELSTVYKTLSAKESATLTEFERAVLEYIRCPINEDGFRSIAFKQYNTERPKILLLGDSFTWGHSASTNSNSFADELLAKGYVVYNTGISGTDISQYLAIAKQYIPVLKPDIVIVNFYIGNDITYYKREMKPFVPVYFRTNAGHLASCPCGKYFESANEAYEFNLHQWKIPQDDPFNKVMAQTVITTLFWKVLLNKGIVNIDYSLETAYYKEAEKRKYDKPYCNTELNQLKELAEQNNARFILSSIPEVYEAVFNKKADYPDLFEGLDFIEMTVDKTDYRLKDGHFNDKGHKRYAEFLIREIETPVSK